MDRKKLIRLASIVFIVIVTLIVLEVSIRGINTAIVDYKEKKETLMCFQKVFPKASQKYVSF